MLLRRRTVMPSLPPYWLSDENRKKSICAKASVIIRNWTPAVRSDKAPIAAASAPPTSMAAGIVTRNWVEPGIRPKIGSEVCQWRKRIPTV